MRGIFTQLKGQLALSRLSEDKLIELVLAEQRQGEVDEVALAKAKMDAEGDDKKVEALYIKHRIRRIKDNDDANLAAAASIKQKANEWDQKSKTFSQSNKETNAVQRSGKSLIRIYLLLFIVLIILSLNNPYY
jgi:hypothetical protein